MKKIHLLSFIVTSICLASEHNASDETNQEVRRGVIAPLGDALVYNCRPLPKHPNNEVTVTRKKDGSIVVEHKSSMFKRVEGQPIVGTVVTRQYKASEQPKKTKDSMKIYTSEFNQESKSKIELSINEKKKLHDEEGNSSLVITTRNGRKTVTSKIELICNTVKY